jgi:hypothetical protein
MRAHRSTLLWYGGCLGYASDSAGKLFAEHQKNLGHDVTLPLSSFPSTYIIDLCYESFNDKR